MVPLYGSWKQTGHHIKSFKIYTLSGWLVQPTCGAIGDKKRSAIDKRGENERLT